MYRGGKNLNIHSLVYKIAKTTRRNYSPRIKVFFGWLKRGKIKKAEHEPTAKHSTEERFKWLHLWVWLVQSNVTAVICKNEGSCAHQRRNVTPQLKPAESPHFSPPKESFGAQRTGIINTGHPHLRKHLWMCPKASWALWIVVAQLF